MTTDLRRLALQLYDIGCFQEKKRSPEGKGFRLKLHEKQPDAPLSPYYLNLRTPENPKPGPLTAELVSEIGDALYTTVSRHGGRRWHDRVAGVPHAGDPLARAYARVSGVPLLRLNKITDGEHRSIAGHPEGNFLRGERVLLIDDLITKADSKLEAIAVLTAGGLNTYGAAVILDREQGGSHELRRLGYSLFSILTLSEFLEILVNGSRLTPGECHEILTYARANS